MTSFAVGRGLRIVSVKDIDAVHDSHADCSVYILDRFHQCLPATVRPRTASIRSLKFIFVNQHSASVG